MVLTKSQMLPLGTRMPKFKLPDVASGQEYNSKLIEEKTSILVMFICNHCPFVKHIEKELAQFGKDYKDKNVEIIAISSNDVDSHPDDSPNNLKSQAECLEFNFPYLFDEDQNVAKSFTASRTPDFFLFDKNQKLVYRGQFDDSRPGKILTKVTGADLRAAVDALLDGKEMPVDQKPSVGCNIKWKYGNEPIYFN